MPREKIWEAMNDEYYEIPEKLREPFTKRTQILNVELRPILRTMTGLMLNQVLGREAFCRHFCSSFSLTNA